MSNINQYLLQYAEPETHSLDQFPSSISYTNVVVIPAYNEVDAFFQRFITSVLAKENILLILIINQPDSETDSMPQQTLANKVQLSGKLIWQQHNLILVQPDNTSMHVLIVDRYNQNHTIADKQGVGLARKTGADIATALISKNIINSPWICSTDADAHLPDNYFSVLTEIHQTTSAITYAFQHINSQDEISHATQLYELALRYYVSGLKWAGSSYGFHTIGSTLAFRYDHYAAVRGFPKRSAGEDFYLLNKLAKQAPVRALNEATITLDARLSDRVPFGTGPAVSKILKLSNPADDYLYYNPQLFIELKECLQTMRSLWNNREHPELWENQLSQSAHYALEQLRFKKLIQHIQNHATDQQQCNRHLQQWFDGFRTLKFIHYMQQLYYPPVPLKQAIDCAPFSID